MGTRVEVKSGYLGWCQVRVLGWGHACVLRVRWSKGTVVEVRCYWWTVNRVRSRVPFQPVLRGEEGAGDAAEEGRTVEVERREASKQVTRSYILLFATRKVETCTTCPQASTRNARYNVASKRFWCASRYVNNVVDLCFRYKRRWFGRSRYPRVKTNITAGQNNYTVNHSSILH